MSDRAPVVAYIAGYGRSGSTWLDILLGSHPEVSSLGEAGRLWELAATPTARCVCGEPYARCPQWGPVLRSVTAVRGEAHGIESWLRGAIRRGRASSDARSLDDGRYVTETAGCFRLLAAHTGARVCVDSSNTAYNFFWRPAALSRAVGLDVRLIHLVRDPRGVVASGLAGQNSRLMEGDGSRRPMAGAIALTGWIAANLAAHANARVLARPGVETAGGGRPARIVVIYEDLVGRPQQTLDRIGRFLELDMEPVQRQLVAGEPFRPGHLVAGNRMARQGPVRPRPPVAEPPPLSVLSRLGCWLLARPLYARLRRAATAEG